MSDVVTLFRPVEPHELDVIVGGRTHLEYRIPAEEPENFNAHIAGTISGVATLRRFGEA